MKNDSLESPSNPSIQEQFRPLALVLELTPFLVAIIGMLSESYKLIVSGFSIAALFYLVLPWYLFKAKKYRLLDIIIACVLGQALCVIWLSILFFIMQWEYYPEMLIIAHPTLLFGLAASLMYMAIRTTTSREKNYEWNNSIKLFSRFFIIIILFYAFGMNVHFEAIFNQ
ncbi:MAG: hypothetical protein AAFP19_21915 [Bacteroidota bacterium]